MSRFLHKLSALLNEAAEQQVIDPVTAARLREMAEDRERSGGVLSLVAVLGWLGAAILGLGVILLISANWDDIPSLVKLLGFFVLFAAVNLANLHLRRTDRLPWFAEGLSFLGAVLFLAGIGLISQIYQVEGRPPTAVLIWLVAIAPLAWCFRSPSVTLLSLLALVLWLHLEQFNWSGPAYRFSPASVLMIEVGVGTALIGLAAVLREPEPVMALVFRATGLLLLLAGVYALGFYRHLASDFRGDSWIAAATPAAALLAGAVGLVVGYHWMLPGHAYLRDRLVILLSCLLGVSAWMLLTDLGLIPRGPDLAFFNFGWYRTFHLADWTLSVAAWVLWFALALWCVLFASRTGRRAYLNVGVLAVGLGVITRFFDLMGGLFQTGLAFVVGGAVLLATCFAVEYWRRGILWQLKQADQQRPGAKP